MGPQGIALFPGVNHVVSASISVTHGITPAVATLEIAPQLNFTATGGTLRFLFADREVAFPDCKVDYFSMQRNRRGLIWRFTIFDRRWKWRFGKIAGQYNHLDASGEIERKGTDQSWEATPQELASRCLLRMGEQVFDVTDLPNEARPVIDWDEVNPAGALARLCDELGCWIVMGLADSIVRLRLVGAGEELPIDDDVQVNSLTINPPERPKEIGVLTGPIRYQMDFALEPVGIDNDKDEDGNLIGTIKHIDDLGYKPEGGWGDQYPLWFIDVVDANDRKLALKSVWRYYRINFQPAIDNVALLGFDSETAWYIEYLNEQIATVLQNGAKTPRRPVVWGEFYAAHGGRLTSEPADIAYPFGAEVPSPFTFDRERTLVIFRDPVYGNGNTASDSLVYDEPLIHLRTACILRWPFDRTYKRYDLTRQISETETETQWLRHDELYHAYLYGELQNFGEVSDKIEFYLDAAERAYRQEFPQTITYAGLKLIQLDGAIRQATFRVGLSGCTTIYSRNTEQLDRTPSYRQRRLTEETADKQSAAERHLSALRRIEKPHKAYWVGDVGAG